MASIIVDTAALTLTAGGRTIGCVIGRNGAVAAAEKREGDGRTPTGRYPVRALLLHPDRNPVPTTALPWRWLRPGDGWSDDVRDPAYNRPIRQPHAFSAERLWRDDGLYDLIVVIGHNDAPPVPGMGSAIFLHCLADDGRATEGCVAVAKTELWRVVEGLRAGDVVAIR